jgi:eukaryotic-like serine/threonine-protein kinase
MDSDGQVSPDATSVPTDPIPQQDGPGTLIGRYRLLQKIGESGMGEVWLAEQKEPVRRRVALKLIKAGMNSREVIARFESGVYLQSRCGTR